MTRPSIILALTCLRGLVYAVMLHASSNLIAQNNSVIVRSNPIIAEKNYKSQSHRIEKWELLEGDFSMATLQNEAHGPLFDNESVIVGRGWMPVKYTPAINDLYCPHPSPTACSENCGHPVSAHPLDTVKFMQGFCGHTILTACNKQCKSVEWREWTYRAALFESAQAAQKEEHHFLQIKQWEGAYIQVYINGKLVNEVNPLVSSFGEVTIDLDGLINKDGNDSVYIFFASPSQLGAFYSERSGMVFPADNEALVTTFGGSYGLLDKARETSAKASPFLRKPIVQYGWDIAPRRVLVGLGEGAFVHGWSENYLQALNISEDSMSMGLDEQGKAVEYVYGHADLYYLCDTQGGRPDFVRVTSGNLPDMYDDIQWDNVRVVRPWNAVAEPDVDIVLMSANGFGVQARYRKLNFRIKNPKRWYPNGLYQQVYGDSLPARYHIKISAHQKDRNGRNQIHNIERDWGVRLVRLDTSGGRFAFSINGISVFAVGANVIWARQFGDSASLYPERLFLGAPGMMGELDVMRWQGYNMLRIWGGGAYPSEAFYDRCDALGIMVWQDLMFNGTMYPDAPNFMEAAESEVLAQAMRLNNHPSLAMWCGNNEIEVAWHNWGWQQKYGIHAADSARMWQAYLSLFDTLIPKALNVCSSSVPYSRSSPIGNWGNLQQMKQGDNHDWGVWHGERGFAHLDSARMPFCSEYGLPSLSNGHWREAPLPWESSLLSYKGPQLLRKYVETEYPKSWPHRGVESVEKMDFGDSAAVVQGEFLYRAMISHRMASPFCMGSLFWQYNDIWNGTTWSVVNKEGGWGHAKSSQGRVAEAMLPVVMKLQPSGWWGTKDQFYVQFHSRLFTDCKVPLEVTAYDSMGQSLFTRDFVVNLTGNWSLRGDELFKSWVWPISFAGKRKYRKKIDRVKYYAVRLHQPAVAQQLLDLTPHGKHYGEGYPVLEECLWVGAPQRQSLSIQ